MYKNFCNLRITNLKIKKTLKRLWTLLKIKTNFYVKLKGQLRNNKNITIKLKRIYDYEFFFKKKKML